MNTDGADKTQHFIGWLSDVVGKVPGIDQVSYAGVTEVSKGNLLRVIFTNGHIGTEQFYVAVSNTAGLDSTEMLTQFKQSVTSKLADMMTANKSLPS